MHSAAHPPDVIVLTSQPEAYRQALEGFGLRGHYLPDICKVIDTLLDGRLGGRLVVDARLVMAAPPRVRDRLFSLSGRITIVRSRVEAAGGRAVFLDDLGTLAREELDHGQRFRASVRVAVDLPVAISREEDPAMAVAHPARLTDISEGGSFIVKQGPWPAGDYLHLKLTQLANPLPILCNIRWRKPSSAKGKGLGFGVKFMDIRTDQLDELRGRFLDATPGTPESDCPG